MTNRLDAKCLACGHIWTVVHLPLNASLLRKFSLKSPCPKCHAPKPVMAGKDDLTEADRLRRLLLCAHDMMARSAMNLVTDKVWDAMLADMKKEIDNG